MAFTKIAAAGIGSTGTVTLEHVVVTGSVETPVITGAASTANVSANSLVVSGVSTLGSVVATTGTFSGNVSIAGTLTYEDVTNIDSVGLITARSGIRVNSGGVVLVGSATSTGTASQPLQVTGGAYVSGNLGIGTTRPIAPLTIQSDSISHAIRILGRTSDNKSALVFYDGSQTNYYSYLQSGPNYLAFGIVNEVARFDSVGNFLVGAATSTGTASQPLQVTGGAYISGNLGIGSTNPIGSLVIDGSAGGNSWTNRSNLPSTAFRYDNQGLTVAAISVDGASSNGGVLQLYDRATGNTQIHLDSAPGVNCWIIGRNLGIETANPQTSLHVNGQIIGQVGSGSGILYTTYGALSSGQVASYNNNLLGYNLRGYISSLDGGASNNNFYAMNTASYGFSGIEQAYGGFINFYTCNTTYQATTANTTVTPRLAAVINPGGTVTVGDVLVGTNHIDIMKMWRTADIQGYKNDYGDGGSISYTWDNGTVRVDSSIGSHNWDIGKVRLPAGIYQLYLQYRPSPTQHGWNVYGTNSNAHIIRLQSDAGYGSYTTYTDIRAQLNKDVGYSYLFKSGTYEVSSETTYRIGMQTDPYTTGGYKCFVEASYLIKIR